jgi:hypothetical protein
MGVRSLEVVTVMRALMSMVILMSMNLMRMARIWMSALHQVMEVMFWEEATRLTTTFTTDLTTDLWRGQ